jgi:PAS domain S-box-containing protein
MTAATIARVGQSLCLAGATFGAFGLYGWLSGTGFGTTIVPGLPPMTPNTALSLLIIGASGAARRRERTGWIQTTLSLLGTLVVFALAVATLTEHGFGVDLRIDRRLIPDQPVTPVRPSPPTASSLALLAAALLLFDFRPTSRVRPSEWLVLCAALTAFTSLTGIVLGADPLFRVTRAPVIGFSLPTALGLLLTSMGLLLERPTTGLMRVATSPGPGGVLLRRLTLPIVVVPVTLAFVVTSVAELQAIEDVAIPVAVLAAALTAGGLLVVITVALPLDRAHAQLVASRMQTQMLVEQAPDGIFVADLDGRYIDVNDAACRLAGYPREELLAKTIADLVPAGDVERLWESRALLLAGATQVAEWTLVRKDGSCIPVDVSTRILPDGRWQAVVRDISERIRLEAQAASAREQLRESEERFRLAIDEAPIGMAMVAPDGRFIRVNHALCDIVGYGAEELTGLTFQDITHADDLNADLDLAGQLYRGDIPRYQLEQRYIRKDGTIVWVMVSRSILRDRSGEPVCYIAQMEDITARRRLEDEHRFLAEIGPALATTLDYEETLSRIAEIAVHGLADVSIVDLVSDSGDVHRVRVVSRDPSYDWVRDVFGLGPRDQHQADLIRSALESRQPVLMAHPAPEDLGGVAQSHDHGRARHAIDLQSVAVIPLVAGGTVLGAMSFLSVARSRPFGTDDVRVANQLAERSALAIENARLYSAAQRAIQVRDEVLGIVAHDLRNPLAAVLLEAQVLHRTLPATGAESRESAEAITRAAQRMNHLIQDLMDVTRLEAGRLSIQPHAVSATQLAGDACELHRALASSCGLELRLNLPEQLPDVWADRERLLQVFDNLIANAVKFAASGGSITVGAASRDHDVLFWVADQGPGISFENQAHLFDRFWQAQAAGRSSAGLGLPIVKGIVDAHGGRVWVESAPDRGSTFFFTIPAAEYVARSSADPTHQPTVIRGHKHLTG